MIFVYSIKKKNIISISINYLYYYVDTVHNNSKYMGVQDWERNILNMINAIKQVADLYIFPDIMCH